MCDLTWLQHTTLRASLCEGDMVGRESEMQSDRGDIWVLPIEEAVLKGNDYIMSIKKNTQLNIFEVAYLHLLPMQYW